MITKKTLRTGQPGTQKWINKYGEHFLCIRYKYDPVSKKKCKTVELLIDEKEWIPSKSKNHPDTIVKIKIYFGEVDLGKQIRSLGGKWNRTKQYWEVPYRHVVALGLEDRLIEEKN